MIGELAERLNPRQRTAELNTLRPLAWRPRQGFGTQRLRPEKRLSFAVQFRAAMLLLPNFNAILRPCPVSPAVPVTFKRE